jgi:hypothetical protein
MTPRRSVKIIGLDARRREHRLDGVTVGGWRKMPRFPTRDLFLCGGAKALRRVKTIEVVFRDVMRHATRVRDEAHGSLTRAR